MHIERVDPLRLGLDTADELSSIERASLAAASLDIPASTGPSKLAWLQRGSDSRPAHGLWVAHTEGRIVGYAQVGLPWRDNTDTAHVRGGVHPDARRRGGGRALLGHAVSTARDAGRTKIYAGAYEGSDGIPALRALGFSSEGLLVNAVRRVDVHGPPRGLWDRLYGEALERAGDYELIRRMGPTPHDMAEDMATLHEAINDAPLEDPDLEGGVWDTDRVRSYDRAMADRRQTVYRAMARHRETGNWAGLSMVCVDEFQPMVAFQEDTSVVRAHRGHRLGLLMKTDMLRWISAARPEVTAIDTWNAVTNHHMIAVNERLGATVVARHVNFRLRNVGA